MKFYVLVGAFWLAACVETGGHKPGTEVLPSDAGSCQDNDGDGFGEACERGGDCDDADPKVHTGCDRCVTPQQGCDCDGNTKAVSCYLNPSQNDDGTVMCHEGTRYCRSGEWSACESVVAYPKPELSDPQAIVTPDAGPVRCNDCNINCYVIRDNLDPLDAGIDASSTNAQLADGGGLTLKYTLPEAGMATDSGMYNPSTCVVGTAPDLDCDGILDKYDPYPLEKPFATANPTIFLDIAPGATGTGLIKLNFFLNSADVYFLIDQSGSMDGERDQLKASLVTGDFIQSASYACGDYDFDHIPNNELKTQGIIGAIRCIIRDANFGLGYFREIPFSPSYADNSHVAFRNLSDITSNVSAVSSIVSQLTTVGNYDWPEDSMIALNTVVTGNGMYFGTTKPGIPTRTGCPANTWGYPCFRNKSIPIVLLFTDAQFHNGPTNNAYAYSAGSLGITQGTNSSYTAVNPTNENYTSALDLGDLSNSFYSYTGRTTGMASDLGYSAISCVSSGQANAPDAMFKFTLGSTKTVTATTTGSDFDTTLTIFRGAPATVSNLPAYPNTNDTGANAYAFGSAVNRYVQASGNSSSLVSDYSANDVACGAAPGSKDATFTFTLNQSTKVALDTAGSSYGTVVGLFSGTPPTTTYSTISNANDTFTSAYPVGNLNGKNLGFSGDTSVGTIAANYTAAQLNCSSAPADAATDAVYSFSLTSPTKVRVSTEDSTTKLVVALTDNGTDYVPSVAVPNTNEAEGSAFNIGGMEGKALQYTGSTSSMLANFSQAVIGCGAGDTSKDAVYKFTLGGTRTLTFDTVGSGYDTVLSLFKNTVAGADTNIALSSNAYETGLSAYSIGTVNSKRYVVSGGTTSSMAADYNTTQIGCSVGPTSPDAVFKFHLDTATTVRVDTNGSSFDTLVSLHNGPLPDLVATTISNTNEAAGSALTVSPTTSSANLRFDGSTSSMTADVAIDNGAGCAATSTTRDAVFKLLPAATGNYELNTIGSSFDTVLGLFPSTTNPPTPPTPSAQGGAGDVKTSPVPVPSSGNLDGQWLSYTGSTGSAASNDSFNSCGANSTSKDVFYRFTLGAAATVVIDTVGSGFDTVIGLFNNATSAQIACDNDSGGGTASRISQALAAGTYYVIIKGKTSGASGNYQITFRDSSVSTTTSLLACDDDGGGSTTSKITTSLTGGQTYYVVVKGKVPGQRGAYSLAVKQLDYIDAANRVTCDDDSGSSTSSLIQQNLAAGDYYVVVKGKSNANKGSYILTVQDITTPPAVNAITCNDDVASGQTSSYISQSLTAGTYYLVVKGYNTTSGSYTLNMRDSAVTSTSNLDCKYNNGAGGTALIETDLGIGTYRVIVKGKTASDKGAYKLILRDMSVFPSSQSLGCDRNSGAGGKSHLERTLNSGTYTVVMKGDSSSSGGTYNLSLRDASNISTADAPVTCNNDASWSTDQASISQSLTAGTYYVALKGYSTSDAGNYQLNIGAGSTTAGTYVPPTWSETLSALNAKSVRVIPVLSCKDDPTHGDLLGLGDCVKARNQAIALANGTNSLGKNLQPLVFDILGDGTGLSKTVVDGVAALANYLEMNVSARVVFSPDANPGFGVVVKAVDEAGDGCSGLVGIEHQHCVPGASPRFDIAFTNPLAAPVPLNTHDPKGGYNFRAELIGDNQFIVDQVPIYIIPQNVTTTAPVPQVAASGSYWQDIAAPGCVGNQRPDWKDLTWNANIPNGTSVAFNVCASNKATDLTTCPLIPLCKISGGASCTTDSQCTNGFCSSSGNCQTVTAGACSNDSQCSAGASCKSSLCTYPGQPVYAGAVLGSANYSTNLRMQIAMTGNVPANTGPVVHDWSVSYICNNML